jgi:hypothetical protein
MTGPGLNAVSTSPETPPAKGDPRSSYSRLRQIIPEERRVRDADAKFGRKERATAAAEAKRDRKRDQRCAELAAQEAADKRREIANAAAMRSEKERLAEREAAQELLDAQADEDFNPDAPDLDENDPQMPGWVP